MPILRASKVGIWSFAYSFFYLTEFCTLLWTIKWLTLSMKLRTFIPPLRSKLERKSATFIVSITFRREPKRHYINFGEFVGELVCRRVGLSASWFVGELSINRYSGTMASETNWRGPWKNRISSTTTKLRKSLIKPVTWQNISSYLILPPEIVWTTQYNCRFSAAILPHHWLYEWFSSAKNVHRYMRCAWRSRVEEPNNVL